MVAITCQVPHRISGTDTFEDMSIAEVTHLITKHNYLIFDVDDIPRVIHERKTFGDHCIDFFHIVLGVIITTGLQDYLSLVLDHLDPDDKLFTYRLYHITCRDTKDNRLIEYSASTSCLRDHAVIANDIPPPTPCNRRASFWRCRSSRLTTIKSLHDTQGGHQRLHSTQHGVSSSIE
jgi:hypothetical protein